MIINESFILCIYNMPTRNSNGCFIFKDYPEFQPNVSPREMFKAGAFGGTYFILNV